ncbi:hypothetical protein [Acetobacter tropicalis]|uniref:hypothetical protein n=1 Tax=Acetobacter tropicalis TaxID=104102 RepID=UPI0005866400|nr:hypothetical protein [Acetobacter tropicalis]
MIIRKKIISLFCGLSLILGTVSCSEIQAQKATITSESLLAVLEKAADQYKNGQFGTPNQEIVNQIIAYDDIAYNDIVTLREKAQNNQTISSAETLAATTAVTVFENFLISKNILSKKDISN